MTDRRTPILYIAPWVDLGGSDRGTIDWFKHIDRRRWAPSLITTQPSPNRWLHHIEPFAEEVWDLPDLMPGGAFPEFILGFIESRGVRVVHIMNSRLAFDLLPDMTCLPEPPAVVVQLHAEEPNQAGYVRYASRRYPNLIDAFSVVSEDLKETIVAYEVPPSRIEVIYLGVDGEREFDPARVEALDLPGNDVKRILWPGRLVEQKDPMLTLEVLARARERGAEFVFDVVGDGHMKDARPCQAERAWSRRRHPLASAFAGDGALVSQQRPAADDEPLRGNPAARSTRRWRWAFRLSHPPLPGNVELMDADSGVLVDPRDDVDSYADAIISLLATMSGAGIWASTLEAHARQSSHRRRWAAATMSCTSGCCPKRRRAVAGATRSCSANGSLERARRTSCPRPLCGWDATPLPERTVGVIVPCYRHGIFIDACIASIKAQTLAPASIVVVDDGSDDPETNEALARLDEDPGVDGSTPGREQRAKRRPKSSACRA